MLVSTGILLNVIAFSFVEDEDKEEEEEEHDAARCENDLILDDDDKVLAFVNKHTAAADEEDEEDNSLASSVSGGKEMIFCDEGITTTVFPLSLILYKLYKNAHINNLCNAER